MKNNISNFSDLATANTCDPCTVQRAENLYLLGAKNILELCVGPSLRRLEEAYKKFHMSVTGNDIDPRWKEFYPRGKWLIGDATKLSVNGFDTVVVAPPLSKGCSGKREDSLMIEQVTPKYNDFFNLRAKILVFVLPGRSLATREDRSQYHKFLTQVSELGSVTSVPLKNKVTKYIDVYVERNNFKPNSKQL